MSRAAAAASLLAPPLSAGASAVYPSARGSGADRFPRNWLETVEDLSLAVRPIVPLTMLVDGEGTVLAAVSGSAGGSRELLAELSSCAAGR